ncbi:MAG TPA: NfeD family protein [Acidimicrobiia bacterium]|jgi:membrane protein implicated in regulation of membrane protease activity|nr:NfeD family protein [Acidimicrobiia bacterium]
MDNEIWRWLWTGLAVVLAVGEIFTAGFFLLPFAVGGATAAILAWVDVPVGWQWVAFFVVSIGTLLYLRRFIRKQDIADTKSIGANRYLNMQAIVLEQVDPVSGAGRVRVESEEWRATSDGDIIEPGTPVTITEVRGTRLVVHETAPKS